MTAGIDNVGVLGLGVMGFDIAFLYAMRGYRTVAYDAAKNVMDALPDRREQTIERLKKRNRISDKEAEQVRIQLVPATEFGEVAGVDFVTEAVSESAKTKIAVYRALGNSGFKGILTTNTSSLPRRALLSGGSYDGGKFATTHFFNPVLYTRMVEVVRGDMDENRFDSLISFLKSLDRSPVETEDISGFVSNSILMYYAVMALHLLQSGARIEQVDQAAKHLGLLPPFISFDSWKPSIVEDVTRVMAEARGDTFLRSSKLLSILARNNPAFYVAQKPNPQIYDCVGRQDATADSSSIERALKAAIYVAAARVVELGEDPIKVDFIAVEGIKIPHPPLKEIDHTGAATVIKDLDAINGAVPGAGLNPPRILAAMANEKQNFYRGEQANPWIRSFVEHQRSHASH
ncbi:MAG: 3-hydroxyacyl-CoA dehydrogenase family protein [Candidatus Binatia bacterium]